jgi:hypothetical protein
MSFRSSVQADYLNSWLREMVFTSLAEREVDLGLMLSVIPPEEHDKWVLTILQNGLETAQKEQALEHWKGMYTCRNIMKVRKLMMVFLVMRDVLPDVVWETY